MSNLLYLAHTDKVITVLMVRDTDNLLAGGRAPKCRWPSSKSRILCACCVGLHMSDFPTSHSAQLSLSSPFTVTRTLTTQHEVVWLTFSLLRSPDCTLEAWT